MKKCLLIVALLFAGFCTQANAQYGYYNRPNYYGGPVFYNANNYLRQTTYNRNQYYNLGSANAYLRGGMANTHHFYGF
jgi:hypothetical protein